MAPGARPLGAARALGGAAAALVAAFAVLPILVVWNRADGATALGPADWAAVRFTLWQATLSAVFSILFAVPVARALARRRFPGRGILVALMGAPFILPVIVAILGLLAVFGRGGVVNAALGALGLPPMSVYGLHGVVLAHVFFNMPLAVRLILQGWMAVPAERFRLAAALDLGPGAVFRHIEWPMLRDVVPGALMVIFLICLTSFAVALTLGGGPDATTVELAIYQAFMFEFDLGKAALLALVQFGITVLAGLLAFGVARRAEFGAGAGRPVRRWDAGGAGLRALDALWLGVAALFLLVPLSMVVLRGLPGLGDLDSAVWWAAVRSLGVAFLATGLTLALALPIALAAALMRRGSNIVEGAGYLTLAASPLVIGPGLFIAINSVMDPGQVALLVTALVNAVMALPFALRALAPATRRVEADFGRLADSLDLVGWARLRWLILPRLKGPLAFAAGLTAALSIGDLGVIVLFSAPDAPTLPLQIFRLISAYRMEAAAGASLLLMGLSFGLFWILDRGGRADADLR